MSFVDKSLQCSDCGTTFTFTAGEQEFHEAKGFTNEPRRCPSCRQAKRALASLVAPDSTAKCSLRCVLNVVSRRRYPSSPEKTDQCIAAVAMTKSE